MVILLATNRIARINDDIMRCIGSLLTQVKDPRVQQGLISVTRVDTAGDLRYSKIFLSVLGDVDEREFRRGIKSASGWLRRELGVLLSLRYTPELIFELDKSIEHGAYINKIISDLEIPVDEDKDSDD